jgi:phosphatidylethanolamine/phosphatidyl-N-methylethanolamine N-methyltransferase
MADAVPLGGDGLIVEVGAGTGVVTQALLDRGIVAHRLLINENSPLLFAHLRQRFPHINVLLGDAALLASIIPVHLRAARPIASSVGPIYRTQ